MVNGRRVKGQEIIPIETFDPKQMIEALRAERAAAPTEQSKQQVSDAYKAELRRKMDAMHYKEYYRSQNKKE